MTIGGTGEGPRGSANPIAAAGRFLLRKASKWCFGYDVWALHARMEQRHRHCLDRLAEQTRQSGAIEKRLALVEAVVQAAGDMPDSLWLFGHREERMDATMPFHDETRRAFHLERYRFAASFVAGMAVLDVASGTGYGSGLMRRRGAACAVGVDIDPRATAYARAVHGKEGARFVCADGARLPFRDASVDAVVSFETIEHVPDDLALLAEFRRVIRPGGLLICSTPNQWPLDQAPHHVREYDRVRFEQALGTFFTVTAMHNQNSGSGSCFNRGQEAGIVPTTPDNESNAECYIAVCRKP